MHMQLKTTTGFTILYAVLTASVVLIIALSVTDRIVRDLTLSSSTRDSQRAVFAADAALECTLFWDIKHDGYERSVFGSFGNQATQADLQSGLVGYWPLNEEPGTTFVTDFAGNNHGTLQNADANSVWVPANVGFGFESDGQDDFIEISDDTDISLTESMTLSTWFKPTTASESWSGIVTKRPGTSNGEYTLRYRPDTQAGQFLYTQTDGGVCIADWAGSTYTPRDEWTHITAVRDIDAGTVKLYFDGVQHPTVTSGCLPATSVATPLLFGKTFTTNPRSIDGVVDDVRIYNRALSDAEVDALYKLGTLVGYWSFNESEGIIANDSSLSNNDGALINFSDPDDAWENGKFGNSLHFNKNGKDDELIRVSENDDLQELYKLKEYTYTIWVKPQVPDGNWHGIFAKGNGWGGIGLMGPEVRRRPNDMRVTAWQDLASAGFYTNDRVAFTSVHSMDANDWNHIAVSSTGDFGELRLYVNGVLSQTVDHNFSVNTNDDGIVLGRSLSPTANDIVMDEFRVYSRALSDDEIADLAGDVPPFNSPIDPGAGTGVECAQATITNTSEGWDPNNGWDITTLSGDSGAIVTYDLAFPNGTCATVEITKEDGATKIDSRGYNTCDLDSPRRVERGLRALY